MKRHLRACGVLTCTLLLVSGWAVELRAQSPNVPPDGLVFRNPFLDENGNVTNENIARPDSIAFRSPFLDDSGMVTNPAVPAPPDLEFRTPFLDPEGGITQPDVAPTDGLEFRPIFLDLDGGVTAEDLEPPAGLIFRDPFLGADGNVAVSAVPGPLPGARLLQLDSVSPNPFNPGTQVSFRLRAAADVTVSVLDLRGILVRTLHQGVLPADLHVMRWDGRDTAGRPAASGLYVFRIRAGGETVETKGVLVK